MKPANGTAGANRLPGSTHLFMQGRSSLKRPMQQKVKFSPSESELEIIMSLIDYDEKGYVNRDDMLRIASFRDPMLNIYDQKLKAPKQA